MNAILARRNSINVVAGGVVSIEITDPNLICDRDALQQRVHQPVQPAHWPIPPQIPILPPAISQPVTQPWPIIQPRPGTSGPHRWGEVHQVRRGPAFAQGKWQTVTGHNKIQARWTANMKG